MTFRACLVFVIGVLVHGASQSTENCQTSSLARSLVQHGAPHTKSGYAEDDEGTDCGPLHEDCVAFAMNCGVRHDFNKSWPKSFCGWQPMEDGFIACCVAADHEEAFCSSLATEAFRPHGNASFPGLGEEHLCQEMKRLSSTQYAWASYKNSQSAALVETTKVDRSAMAQRVTDIAMRSKNLMAYFTRSVALATGALLQTDRNKALVGVVLGAVTTHLNGCDPNARPGRRRRRRMRRLPEPLPETQ